MLPCYDSDSTMILFKKLIFAPIYLALFLGLMLLASPLLQTTGLIFSLDLQILYQLIILSMLVLLSSLAFIVFASLSLDWKLILPVIILSTIIPLFCTPQPLNFILSVGTLISLLLGNFALENKMKTYFTFQASALLSPPIKHLAMLLVLALSVGFYLSASKEIAQKGFEIPDSLIDTTLNLMPQTSLPVQGYKYDKKLIAQLPAITPEQIELLKQNPDLLKQYNIDPKMPDNLTTSASSALNPATEVVKPLVKQQLQNIIKPYQNFIPPILALLLFLTLQSFTGVLGLFISPILWIIFYILEKTNFIHFETEMREVKKLVV